MYLGFVMLPQGIGWGLEGYFGPWLYNEFASRENFAREFLSTKGMSADQIAAIPQGEAFTRLVEFTGDNAQVLTNQLYAMNNVGMAWYIIGVIGVVSAVGILLYGKWLFRMEMNRSQV